MVVALKPTRRDASPSASTDMRLAEPVEIGQHFHAGAQCRRG
jgi:hypothetical protein